MNKLWAALFLIAAAASATIGQSGRRPLPVETATPTITETQADYSESKSTQKPQIYRRPVKVRNVKPETASATAEASAAGADEENEIVRVDTDLINIPVSVFDRNGLYISGLRQSDFKVFEDGIEQEIAYFGTSEKPFTVILLLDTSPSTEYKIEDIQRAAVAFVDQLKAQDKVMVIEFDANVHVLTEPTGDRQSIYKAIKRADFGGGTSLYEAVNFSLAKRLNAIDGRKAIVLFTDGVDTTSRRASYDSTLALAEESDALVFPIYYNTFLDTVSAVGSSPFPGLGYPTREQIAKEYALGKKYIEDLALMTGGRVFRPEATPGGLTNAFEGIAEELRRQYNIGYLPKTEGEPGQRRSIKVRVARPNLVLRARDTYIVGVKQ